MFSRFRNFITQDRFLIGVSLLRICIGLIILYQYLIHYGQRYFLFSAEGVMPFYEGQHDWSLYHLSPSLTYFDIIYHLGIVVSFIYLLGFKGRIFTVLNFVFYYSLYQRYGHISDGGDNILIICMFYLMFANNTAYFSLDHARFKRYREANKGTLCYQFSAMLHNFAVLFCIVQLCILYFFSGMYQLMGELWHNGTAIYYISQVKEFSRPLLRYLVEEHLWLTIIITYFTMWIKIAFPFTILNKKLKPFIVAAMVTFHLGICIGMGLLTFSVIMIILEFLVFTDKEYRNGWIRMNRFARKLQYFLMRTGRVWGKRRLAPYQIIVFYDGWCPMCRRIMRSFRRLDYFGLLKFASFRNPQIIVRYGLVPQEVEKRMHSMKVASVDKKKVGIHSIVQICTRLVPLWPLVPFLYLSEKIGIGSVVYDYIASKRNLIPVNHCGNDFCDLPQATIGR
ncbi:DCC1-like thiol-disulfide oxidoreductase family protein [Brevibacillus sedimenti]|uniref:DCC1-like thiol-disulfide oxidoreductase family protein n=1 Tax=Brevibacillus sedimenti TaxID=2613334 RepID=UPI001E4B2E0B|nr:DCC1-like thiol-disulfide oxidoreductase family protein [Anoxybacillus sediminis]UFJ62332.1 DUF393 domain-containing protein [Anoxybacillus sediminis]